MEEEACANVELNTFIFNEAMTFQAVVETR
jgi:hypothetical protein